MLGLAGMSASAQPAEQNKKPAPKTTQRKAAPPHKSTPAPAHKTTKPGQYPPQGKATQERAATKTQAQQKAGKSATNSASKYPIEHGSKEQPVSAAQKD